MKKKTARDKMCLPVFPKGVGVKLKTILSTGTKMVIGSESKNGEREKKER